MEFRDAVALVVTVVLLALIVGWFIYLVGKGNAVSAMIALLLIILLLLLMAAVAWSLVAMASGSRREIYSFRGEEG